MNGRTLHLVGSPSTSPPRRTCAPVAFINYRSSDDPWAAISLHNALAAHFGPQAIFIDTAHVDPGDDYRPALLRAVVRSSVLLVVIGQRWLAPAQDGHCPLNDETDWVRQEISLALVTGVLVVPVLVGEVDTLHAHDLPEDLQPMAYHQYVRLRPSDAERDLQRIARHLERLSGGAAAQPTTKQSR